MLSVFRRRIKETRRFEEVKAGRVADETQALDARAVAHRATGATSCSSGLIHMFRSIPLFGSTAWWAFYAERERGFTSGEVAFYIICAYGLGCIGYYVCGRSMERFGRRPTALVYGVGGDHLRLHPLFQTTSKPVAFVGLGARPCSSAWAWAR